MTDTTGPAPSHEQGAKSEKTCVCGGQGPALTDLLKKMMPSEAAGEHFRNARLELLKGFRELLDHRIQTLSQEPSKGTKLNVE